MSNPNAEHELQAVYNDCYLCDRCPLATTRTNIVFGSGSANAKIMIIGEAPGKNEDLQGKPFVGAAGRVLNDLLEIAGVGRDGGYIANVLKCRPPQNRDPATSEIIACEGWLEQQMRIIQPAVIVTLGNYATRWAMPVSEGITTIHGKLYARHVVGGLPVRWNNNTTYVFPSYHPAAALYDRSKMPIIEEDFRKLGNWLKTQPEA